MSTHLVVGAGPVGTRTALLLAEAGASVRVVTRSGGGPDHPAVERVAADASDAARMRSLATGAVAVYNCANPAYTRWDTDWPPIAAALLDAAASSGAVLATVSNLYGYGRVSGPIGPDTPLAPCDHKGEVRVRMWRDALAAHEAGRVRVVEVRSSDYADAGSNSHLARNAPAVLEGRTAWVLGAADQPHSWTTTHDTARLLVDLAGDDRAHGRAWLVPTAPPRTQREALADVAGAAGVATPRVRVLGPRALRAAGVVAPMLRQLSGTAYQFTAPFVVDDAATTSHVGWGPEDWDVTVARVVRAARTTTVQAGAR
ncbi:NAD-dependent epimerase/dehydratase family protein [Fodinibacter luteus]|uniref:NAD-dependent epimerase/dehydratase family protein n=1 Tax=Fodinibacter luteus TaxID=552064 RepID=A0ABP8KQ37_9MICO